MRPSLAEPVTAIETVDARERLTVPCDAMLERTELRFRASDGVQRALSAGEEADGVALALRQEKREGADVVLASIANLGPAPVYLDSVRFRLATGFSADAPARFFKHGYQSWSASRAVAVGAGTHPRDGGLFLVRLNHQSEVTRPDEAAEAATSEMFTIVESASSRERMLAGFIGAAHQLTTITVANPEQILARALLDGAVLNPGERRTIEPLVLWRSEEGAARMAARWAGMLGAEMNARVGAPYQRGWCSWYHYFHAISEDAMLTNLRALKEMRAEFPLELVQLDDGYQSALGDWDITNAKFPGGLKKIADSIRDAGFTAGIWTAPFLTARDARLMREHPEWLLRHESGEPLRAGYNTNWTTDQDAFAYALDPSHPGFAERLERLFRKLVHEFGYDYLKLDFLYAAAAEGVRHDQSLTRAETLRRGLDAIRRGAGERAFILGCGCPLGTAVGMVDGMRIGPDVAPYWGASAAATDAGVPGTALAIDAILARSFMHRRLWLNDPDCLMLRSEQTQLTRDEREALAWTIAASGGMLLISDDMSLPGAEGARLFQAVARIGAHVDFAAEGGEPVIADNLMESEPVRTLSVLTRRGSIRLLVNAGDSNASVLTASITGGTTSAIVDLEGESAPETIDLPAHSARVLLALKPDD